MFWDWLFIIGGESLVNTVSNAVAPYYVYLCDLATENIIFQPLATFLESVLS